MRKEIVLLLLLLALAGVGYCAPSFSNSSNGGAAVYVENYSTIPGTLYSGSTNQLRLTISNTGTETAQSVTVNSGTVSVQLGNMGAGANSITSVPFTIPPDANGVYLLYLTVYYTDSGGSKANQLTIPLEISQQNVLQVETLSVDKQNIFPGDNFTLQLQIRNNGGTANNVVISPLDNSSFLIGGTSYQSIGDIASGSSENVSVTLQSTMSAPASRQVIPLSLTYQDALQNTVTGTINVGPVNILESHEQLRVELIPVTHTEIGSEAQFQLVVENEGSSPESAVVEVIPSSTFTPIGSSRIYFEIPAGENETQVLSLGVNPTAAAGYYELSMNITSGNESYIDTAGISVQATADLTVSGDNIVSPGGSSRLTISIANTGNSAIRSVYINSSSPDLQVVASQSIFVGTLNVDDYFTYQPTVVASPRLTPGQYTLYITINFKDGTNQQRAVTKELEVSVGNGGFANVGNSTFRGRGGGISIFGIDVIPIIEAIIVLAFLYFAVPFVYRRIRGENKK